MATHTQLTNALELNFKNYLSTHCLGSLNAYKNDIITDLLIGIKLIFNNDSNTLVYPKVEEILYYKIILLIGAAIHKFSEFTYKGYVPEGYFGINHNIVTLKGVCLEGLVKERYNVWFDVKRMTKKEFSKFLFKELSEESLKNYYIKIRESGPIVEERAAIIYFDKDIKDINLNNSIVMLIKFLAARCGRKEYGYKFDFPSKIIEGLKNNKRRN